METNINGSGGRFERSRLLRYVGRGSGEPTATLADGTEVAVDEVVEVKVSEARVLLRNPGAEDDSAADWVPEPVEA